MRLRPLALLALLLPGLMAPVGMSWCASLCQALRVIEAPRAVEKHSCCDKPKAPPTSQGPTIKAPCTGCAVVAAPKTDLQPHQHTVVAAPAPALLVVPFAPPVADAPALRLRAPFVPAPPGESGTHPLPLRI